ncbi:MAG: lipopolysaccharide biosynthesis protein [Bacteroidaceae bacterium]|nr:lipopolysaccharide biosynthesis protein [Bacteroidaceae bacterium]MEA5099654.1 lipopolysaccharide biosynthesis protein [Bacteroidales bacterium]
MADSIKKQMTIGIFFTAIAKYSNVFISLIVTAILARIFSPEEFGIVAIATVIIVFFNMLTEIGIGPAIIQNKELNNEDLSNIFSFTIWFGLILTIIFVLLANPIAIYYETPILEPISYYLSIAIFFNSSQIVPNALIYKDKDFIFIAIRSFSIQFFAGIIAVISVFLGFGIYALLINPILSSILLFIISYIKKPIKFKLYFDIKALKKILSFSIYQFLFNLINYFSRNLDKLIIGKYLNNTMLGYYEKSYRLMMLPLQTITHVVSPVMHPIFSDYQNDFQKLSDSYLKIVKLLAYIGFPLSVLLFFTSKELVLLIFGMQWERSILSFQILALSVGFEIILSTSGSIFQAANSTKMLFICGLISTIILIIAILIGVFIFKIIEAVALFSLFAFIINFIITYFLMYSKLFKTGLQTFFKVLISPIILSLILIFILYFTDLLFVNLNLLLQLIIKTIITLIACLLFIDIFKVYNTKDVFIRVFKKKFK